MVLGRHRDCDIVVRRKRVSRRHARVYRVRDGYFLQDLSSSNGTFVNGERIAKPTELNDGDEIRVDKVALVFHTQMAETVNDRPSSMEGTLPVFQLEATDGKASPVGPTDPRMEAIMTVSRGLARSLSIDETLQCALDELFGVFPNAERAFVFLPKSDGSLDVRCRKVRGLDGRAPHQNIPVSRYAARQVMESGEAMLSVDAIDDARLLDSHSAHEAEIRSMMCAPLPDSSNKPLGVIHVDRCYPEDAFKLVDLELLATVARIVGQSMEISYLHEQRVRDELREQDIQVARAVQKSLIPATVPNVQGYEFECSYAPAQQLSGDYVDFLQMPDGRVAIAVGDVAGKGISAALVMSRLHATVRLVSAYETDPARIVEIVNREMCRFNRDMRFATLLLCMIDPATDELQMVHAGHLLPLVRRDGAVLSPLQTDNLHLALGLEPDTTYSTFNYHLEKGDQLLVVTDGITEAINENRELFGLERLDKALLDSPPTAHGCIETVVGRVLEHQAEDASLDDMTVVCVVRH